jgi:hypothetical protein
MENSVQYRRLLAPEEVFLLINARREVPAELLAEASRLIPQLDWNRLLTLTTEHGVGPLIYGSVKRYFSTAIPEPCLAWLRQNTIANAQNNLALLGQLLTIAQQLHAMGIRFAVFKGLVINQMVYQDLAIRKCGDIDILVDKRNFFQIKTLFLSQGFKQTLSDMAEMQYLQSGLWHEERRINIDLHCGIPPRELGIRSGKILDTPFEVTIGGKSFPTFSPEDLFIILCVNATKEYWNQHLYPYCDIHEYLQSHPDLNWGPLLRRARELKCEHMLYAALSMTKILFEISLPAIIEEYISPEPQTLLAVKELQKQLFELDPHSRTSVSQTRHMYFFNSTDDYFIALMDTRWRRFIFRHISRRIKRLIPDDMEMQQTSLPPSLSFLYTAAIPARIAGAVFNKLYRKLAGNRDQA